jgi:hypothetical protein
MRNVFPRVNVTGKSLPALVLCVLLAVSCGSARPPTAPSPTPGGTPTPAPTPPTPVPSLPTLPPNPPVANANLIILPAPAIPPASAEDPLVGRYVLEIVVARSGVACDLFPESVRHRIYTADIHQFREYYAVKLYDAIFLKDGGGLSYVCSDGRLEDDGVCHQFIMRRDAERAVSVIMSPSGPLVEYNGNIIWEVQDDHLIALSGGGTGSIGEGRIVVSGGGGLWYGDGLPAKKASGCAGDMAWIFTRS